MTISKDLVAASATPLILSIINNRESYGYAIIKRVKELSQDQIHWTEGMLYPVLHRLERQSFIDSYWKVSETGRKRKYYRLISKGVEELKIQRRQWDLVHSTLSKSWKEFSPYIPAVLLLGGI